METEIFGMSHEELLDESMSISSKVFDVSEKNLYNTDAKFEGSLTLNDLPDLAQKVDSHGIAKGNEIYFLLNLLYNGIDKNKPFFSAPLSVEKGNEGLIGAGLGTSGGTSYRDGLFIVCSIPGGTLLKDGIRTVLINPLCHENFVDNTDNGRKHEIINLLRYELSSRFPNVDFILYSEAKGYLEYIEQIIQVEQDDDPTKYIPSRLVGLSSELLEEMWSETIYTNPWKTKLRSLKRNKAIEYIKNAENNANLTKMKDHASLEIEALKRLLD